MDRRIFLTYVLSSTTTLMASGCTLGNRDAIAAYPKIEEGTMPVPALPPYGVIGIIAPAGPFAGVAVDIENCLKARGYHSHIFSNAQESTGYLAGTDDGRLHDLHAAFRDTRIDAIICLRGGYGSARLLDRIDFNLLRAHTKPFVGYSDITALHLAIARYAGFVTFHGPMLTSDLLRSNYQLTESALFAMLEGKITKGMALAHPAAYPLTTVFPGVARGKLMGGNLSIIASTLGTPYEIETQDSILFIEDIDEELFRVDRMLTQLRLAGKYRNLRGVLVGDFGDLQLNELMPLLKQEFGSLHIPILAGWRSGHSNPNLTLPLGAIVTLDANQQKLRLEQAIVGVANSPPSLPTLR
ncbi:MAG: LD-carboxypeptidase [Ottowia sp.]|nr:LD-carboxypeptidase [Ottowia sp.]